MFERRNIEVNASGENALHHRTAKHRRSISASTRLESSRLTFSAAEVAVAGRVDDATLARRVVVERRARLTYDGVR